MQPDVKKRCSECVNWANDMRFAPCKICLERTRNGTAWHPNFKSKHYEGVL